jgi:integral membrane protein
MDAVNKLLKQYELFRPFTETEAWGLFRIAAFAEAFGWSLLILGIAIKQYILPGNDIAVQIAGHIHGTLFLIYIASVIIFYPSQFWSRKRTFVALLASVPPYGSLLFEQWAAHKRRTSKLRKHALIHLYNTLVYQSQNTVT